MDRTRKHPCLRRADVSTQHTSCQSTETSLLAQSRRRNWRAVIDRERNIPACAEQTACQSTRRLEREKHPCLRRADKDKIFLNIQQSETSLLAQSRRATDRLSKRNDRNIPACAEQTMASTTICTIRRKHPCLRRADCRIAQMECKHQETSLLAQSRRVKCSSERFG